MFNSFINNIISLLPRQIKREMVIYAILNEVKKDSRLEVLNKDRLLQKLGTSGFCCSNYILQSSLFKPLMESIFEMAKPDSEIRYEEIKGFVVHMPDYLQYGTVRYIKNDIFNILPYIALTDTHVSIIHNQ